MQWRTVWSLLEYWWRFVTFVAGGTAIAIVDLYTLFVLAPASGHVYVASDEDQQRIGNNTQRCVVTFCPTSLRRSRFMFHEAKFIVHSKLISPSLLEGVVASTTRGGTQKPRPVAVVTGGSPGGIGFATCVHLMLCGFDVIAVCRDKKKALACKSEADAAVGHHFHRNGEPRSHGGTIRVVHVDVGNVAAMRGLATTLVATEPNLRVVVTNAGAMAPPPELTVSGYEMQMGTHVAGHGVFLLKLLEEVRARMKDPASTGRVLRIVVVGSAAAVGGHLPPLSQRTLPRYSHVRELSESYDRFQGYRDAKLCNIAMAFALARRISRDDVLSSSRGAHITVNVLHPGPIWSNVVPNSKLPLQCVMDWSVSSSIFRMSPWASGLFVADLCLHRDYDDVTGHYFRMGVDMSKKHPSGSNGDTLWSPGIPSPAVACDEARGEHLLELLEELTLPLS